MDGTPDGYICGLRDEDYEIANRIFYNSATYAVHDRCGTLETCTRRTRHVDRITGESVDVMYCEMGTYSMAALSGVAILALIGVYRLQKRNKYDDRR